MNSVIGLAHGSRRGLDTNWVVARTVNDNHVIFTNSCALF